MSCGHHSLNYLTQAKIQSDAERSVWNAASLLILLLGFHPVDRTSLQTWVRLTHNDTNEQLSQQTESSLSGEGGRCHWCHWCDERRTLTSVVVGGRHQRTARWNCRHSTVVGRCTLRWMETCRTTQTFLKPVALMGVLFSQPFASFLFVCLFCVLSAKSSVLQQVRDFSG